LAAISPIDLIYCGDGNARFAKTAIDAGFIYGAQPLRTTYFPIEFADLHPSNIPPKDAYIAALAEHRPRLATVADWVAWEQLPEVLEWAEEAAAHVETVIIIPKVIGGIARLPRAIGGRPVRLGYSVPTRHGGTSVPAWEFGAWPVHLLGGSPQQQMKLAHYLNVASVDGNMAHKMATGSTRSGIVSIWQPRGRAYKKGHWVPLAQYRAREFGLGPVAEDAPYAAFAYSCRNIMAAWRTK
jgi:hypothetical protein